MATKYSDLTASELQYLAKRGSRNAVDVLRERKGKGDIEASHYLKQLPKTSIGALGPLSAADFLMPHRLIQRAVEAKGSPSEAMRQAGLGPSVSPRGRGWQPGQRRAGMPGGRVPGRAPIPVPGVKAAARPPQWGVFVNYEQEPSEVFDTLMAANAWAATIPPGIFFAVIRAGQEPPRAPYYEEQPASPYGYPNPYAYEYAQPSEGYQPYGSPTGRPLSTYERFQLAQGQRF